MSGKEDAPGIGHWYRDIDYDIDRKGRLVYYDTIGKRHVVLEPAQPIPDPNAVVGELGERTINPTHFKLRESDLSETVVTDEEGMQIGDSLPPGVSAFLFFGTRTSSQDRMSTLSRSHMGREPSSKNKVYIAQVSDIEDAGWKAYFAPLINSGFKTRNPLHVLLVPASIQESGQFMDATLQEKEKLSKKFIPWDALRM